jgi:phenylpropionate dioxygenase-like ring-hydroxylating dioxygenase large terminal subunit
MNNSSTVRAEERLGPIIETTELPTAPPASAFAQYPASWYPFCHVNELRAGPLSKRILGRDLVAFRTASGKLSVINARCSHLGANLGCGHVIGESLQCPFHNWKYGADGRCTHVPGAAKIPGFARQDAYPVVERHGYLFFFNGPEALFPLPFFFDEKAEDYTGGQLFSFDSDCPWYVTSAHACDIQHFEAVHDRRLLATPVIDCPAPFAMRNRYHAQLIGDTILDRMLRIIAGPEVEITITTWGGTMAMISGDFTRAHSRFLISSQPLENGNTLCVGIVFTRTQRSAIGRRLIDPVILAVRRIFTHGYLKDEASRLRQTCYNPAGLIAQDRPMIEYYQWLASLSQGTTQYAPTPPTSR